MSLTRREATRKALAIAALIAAGQHERAYAALSQAPAPVINQVLRVLTPDVHISDGQSWRDNSFNSFGLFGLNPQHETLIALHTTNNNPAPPPITAGPLQNGAGIYISGALDGITGYQASDVISIGRCAVLAEQLFRIRKGVYPNPILEFCKAYPASSWTTGGGPSPPAAMPGLQPGSSAWTNGLTLINAVETLLPLADPRANRYLNAAKFRSVGITQGGNLTSGGNTDPSLTVSDFTSWCNAYDALNLPGTSTRPLKFFFAIRAGLSIDTDLTTQAQYKGIYQFCRANFNGRIIPTTPWYQWPFSGPNDPAYGDIHTGPYGTVRHGEIEGYACWVTYGEGVNYTPLWRSLTQPITVSGQTITVPFDRPAGADFASASLGWQSDPQDGIQVWPQYGWQVYRNGSPLTVTPTISGLSVVLAVAETLQSGDSLEVSYAMRGPGGSNPGLQSGVGGNLMMVGPDSVFFPGKKLNAWAWQFAETITV